MNRIALLVAGAIAIVPVIAGAQSRVYIPPKDSKSQLGYRDIPGLNWREIATHYAPANSIDDWQKVISERHWKKGYSAHQIAHSWQNANPKLPPEIAALFYGAELLAAIPEHKTPLPGGRAPSQSDLLVFIRIKNRVCAVTVEGKKEEGFGSAVGEWSNNTSAGKIKRLKHIAAKLGLAYPPADEIRYQLLHRTASAVIEAERFNADCAATLVHSFSPQHKSFDDFAKFLSAFGIRSAKRDKIYKTTKPGIDLYFGWASPTGTVAVVETAPQPEIAVPAPAKPKPQPAPATETVTVAGVAAPPPKPAAPAKAETQLARTTSTTATTETVTLAEPEPRQPKQQPAVVATAPAKQETRPAPTVTPPKVEAPPEPVALATPKPEQQLVNRQAEIAPQPKPETPALAKPKPQIERAAETTVVAEATASEIVTPAKPAQAAPEKVTIVVEQEQVSSAPAQTPPAQATTTDAPASSWFSANLIWLLLLASLVAVAAVWALKKRAEATRQIHHKLDQIMEKDGVVATADSDAKLTKAEKDSIQKGREFEDFIVEMFHKDDDYFTLMSRSADKFTGAGVSAKDATDPDLKYNFLSRGRAYPFAVECKWRRKFQQDKELTVTSSAGQLQRYKSYERHTKDKTFIVLGVGGTSGAPEHLFVIPVSDIQDPTLTKKELLPFYQRSKGHFTYDPENKVLKMVSD